MLVRVRPNFRIFARRMSTSFTRSPYRVPGSMRLIVALGTPFDSGRPSDGWMTAFDADQFAASGAPWSLLNVPESSTSTFGTVYEPSPVYRVTSPVAVLHHGFVGDCAPRIFCSGNAARMSQ